MTPCERCGGDGIDPENGTDNNPEPPCTRCNGSGDEDDAPARAPWVEPMRVLGASYDDE